MPLHMPVQSIDLPLGTMGHKFHLNMSAKKLIASCSQLSDIAKGAISPKLVLSRSASVQGSLLDVSKRVSSSGILKIFLRRKNKLNHYQDFNRLSG